MGQPKKHTDETQKKAPGFMMYDETSEALLVLDDAALGAVMRAAINYKLHGENPKGMPGALAFPFRLLQGMIDRDNEKYIQRCEKNRVSARERWEK